MQRICMVAEPIELFPLFFSPAQKVYTSAWIGIYVSSERYIPMKANLYKFLGIDRIRRRNNYLKRLKTPFQTAR